MEIRGSAPSGGKAERALIRLVCAVAFVGFALIVFYVLFRSNLSHRYQRTFAVSNLVLGAVGIAAAVSVCLLRALCGKGGQLAHPAKKSGLLMFALTAALFFAQVLFCARCSVDIGADWRIVMEIAENYVAGRPFDTSYLSNYTNNTLITLFFIGVRRILQALQITDPTAVAMAFRVIDCAVSSLTALLVFRATDKLTGDRFFGLCALAAYVLVLGFSSWLCYPYTDAVGVILSVLLFNLYITPFRHAPVKWLLLGAVGFIGYYIKPTTLIMLMAILPFALLQGKGAFTARMKAFLISAAAFFVGAVLVVGGFRVGVRAVFGDTIDPERRTGMIHFAALGMNEATDGTWNYQDWEDSYTAETNAARDAMNLEKLRTRLSAMRPLEFYRFMRRKALVNFTDGMFGISHVGYPLFHQHALVVQSAWLAVLAMVMVAGFPLRKARMESSEAILLLYLIGVALFGQIFEAHARQFFVSVPIFCIAAALGMRSLSNGMARLLARCRKAGRAPGTGQISQ